MVVAPLARGFFPGAAPSLRPSGAYRSDLPCVVLRRIVLAVVLYRLLKDIHPVADPGLFRTSAPCPARSSLLLTEPGRCQSAQNNPAGLQSPWEVLVHNLAVNCFGGDQLNKSRVTEDLARLPAHGSASCCSFAASPNLQKEKGDWVHPVIWSS